MCPKESPCDPLRTPRFILLKAKHGMEDWRRDRRESSYTANRRLPVRTSINCAHTQHQPGRLLWHGRTWTGGSPRF